MRVLLAEDDLKLGKLIQYMLEQNQLATEWVKDGEQAYDYASYDEYDVVILDWMMPKMSGVEVCKKLRANGYQKAIMLLTARDAVEDRVAGLDAGADDYLVKPFAYDELLARIRCVLRRPGTIQSATLSFGDITYDPNSLTLRRGETVTVLSKRLGDLLELFLRNPGQTLPRQTILLRVWGMEAEVEDGNLDNYTYFLRRSLKKVDSRLRLTTLRGVGYRLEDKT